MLAEALTLRAAWIIHVAYDDDRCVESVIVEWIPGVGATAFHAGIRTIHHAGGRNVTSCGVIIATLPVPPTARTEHRLT
ncbi:hypothetical protein [Arthrobacter sp. CJ23]|uniref:hypothetical protein n=1 Tax=Arthrobacter sp. CJ23 TaxID=2972479 RepID=UPI00215C5ECB|nr:hypothetical protein [Arthrobacter sp. CJ23]UVJ39995.1 hypothetical protein NVV90_02020 [Arthrobacter sp. CJ23]